MWKWEMEIEDNNGGNATGYRCYIKDKGKKTYSN